MGSLGRFDGLLGVTDLSFGVNKHSYNKAGERRGEKKTGLDLDLTELPDSVMEGNTEREYVCMQRTHVSMTGGDRNAHSQPERKKYPGWLPNEASHSYIAGRKTQSMGFEEECREDGEKDDLLPLKGLMAAIQHSR